MVEDDDADLVRRRPTSPVLLGAVALVLVIVAVVAVPRLLPDSAQLAAPVPSQPADPAPVGWRTEYYRAISFEVPADWGFALDAQPCGTASPAPPEYRRPFVSHGISNIGAAATCERAVPIEQEHITVVEGPFEPPTIDLARRADGFWLLVHEVGGVRAEVYARDRALAQRIVDSMTARPVAIREGCPADSDVAGRPGSGPAQPFDVSELDQVQLIVVCQYDTDQGGGLRARGILTGQRGDQVLEGFQNGPPAARTTCRRGSQAYYYPILALVVRLDTGRELRDLHVEATSCSGDRRSDRFSFDGTTVRSFSLDTCNLLLVPPVTWQSMVYTGQACA